MPRTRRRQVFNGRIRLTEVGYEVIDLDGTVIAGPNPDLAMVVRWATDLGITVEVDPDLR